MNINEDFASRSKIEDIGRWYVTKFVEGVASRLAPGSLVLDAGAGECVYKKYFIHCRYFSVDLAVGGVGWNYKNLDFIGKLDRLPAKSSSFDAILCTQTLEHLEWPREAVEEFYRILKPGGKLYITVPMAHGEHQAPYDFFRYTSYGLRSILRQAGFGDEDVTVAPFGGLCMRMAYEMPRLMGLFNRGGRREKFSIARAALLPVRLSFLAVIRAVQLALIGLDRFDTARNDPFGWSAEARKQEVHRPPYEVCRSCNGKIRLPSGMRHG